MFYRVSDLSLCINESVDILPQKAAKELGVLREDITAFSIYRRSLDARGEMPIYRFSVNVTVNSKKRVRRSKKVERISEEYSYRIPAGFPSAFRPLVVGFGPAGMFAALVLARAGLCPIVVERGKRVEDRERDVQGFLFARVLDTESNIQFGEGGAGTFSDGKLNTLLKDKNERGRFVLEEFVKFGAPEEILYLNKPHIGTDYLKKVVKNLREEIIRLGGEIFFETRFLEPIAENNKVVAARVLSKGEERILPSDAIFLGIGHSARDTFSSLLRCGVKMEKKIFSVGVRIEHLQDRINRSQYGKWVNDLSLPTADYKLSCKTSSGKILYTFCMCPGGVVVPATSEKGAVVTNGMSNFARNGKNANSALLFNVLPQELGDDIFSGFQYQKYLEEKAFTLGGGDYSAPCQLVGDFLKGEKSVVFGDVIPSYALGATPSDFTEIFTGEQCEILKEGIMLMGQKLSGFDCYDAVLTGVESRATCPVRILRDETFQSNLKGLYPIGEGAGYAGGIMSSAMDGMKSVEAYCALRR